MMYVYRESHLANDTSDTIAYKRVTGAMIVPILLSWATCTLKS